VGVASSKGWGCQFLTFSTAAVSYLPDGRSSTLHTGMAATSTPEIYVEGNLFKRPRGLHPSRMPKKKWVQKRFCRLTGDSF